MDTSSIYRFTNEDISSYFHHLKNKKNVLTVIGSVLSSNPYLQDDNYQKLRHLLQTEDITINPRTFDIFKERFEDEYDLVNLSNILSYYYPENDKERYISFLNDNFSSTSSGEIINYFYDMTRKNEQEFNSLLQPNGYIESLDKKKLLVYKK